MSNTNLLGAVTSVGEGTAKTDGTVATGGEGTAKTNVTIMTKGEGTAKTDITVVAGGEGRSKTDLKLEKRNSNSSQQPLTADSAEASPAASPKPSGLNPKTKTTSVVFGIVLCVIIIVLVVVAVQAFGDSSAVDQFVCGCSTDLHEIYFTDLVLCGNATSSITSGEECAELCDHERAYFVDAVSTCYCDEDTHSASRYSNESEVVANCLDAANVTVIVASYESCCGRPYLLPNQGHMMQARVKHIGCSEYTYHDDEEWLKTRAGLKVSIDKAEAGKWIQQGLAEHASVASFAKFSLELMQLGAPLWLLELSNKAALDEIRHAQLSFDIANLFGGKGEDAMCVTYGAFPEHTVELVADWNAIANDAAQSGCIGEAASAVGMVEKSHGVDVIDEYVYGMAQDEIRHAALSCAAVKWMIDNHPSDVVLDVEDEGWWVSVMVRQSDARVRDLVQSVMVTSEVKQDSKKVYDTIIDRLEAIVGRNDGAFRSCTQ